jgi:hypothetical protein
MACDVQTLITNGSCFVCGVPVQLIRLALLCRIKNGVTMACDVQTLLSEASCFSCVPPGQLAYVELALLCQIAVAGGGGGGGGSGAVTQGIIDPVAAPATPGSPAIYTNLTSGVIFSWDVTNQVWV